MTHEQRLTQTSTDTEDYGFAIELAMAFGIDWDADNDTIACDGRQLYALMVHLGYKHRHLSLIGRMCAALKAHVTEAGEEGCVP